MSTTAQSAARATDPVWLSENDCHLTDLEALVSERTDLRDYPLAESVEQNVLIYDSARLRDRAKSAQGRHDVQGELVRALMDGPGLVVFTGAFTDVSIMDRATDAFATMIAEQRASGAAAGDHFAKPGANDRVWNALEKLAVREPAVFAAYYANEVVELVSSAWLGPHYQLTSQVNVVNPGGAAQTVHRDYHLGFQSNRLVERYPSHVHRLSPVLTLQGAVAHSDMPVETGPTMYLPHSQKYELGYLAWRRPQFQVHFDEHHVQLPLGKGDAAFFNPALFHAAGHNRSADVKRMANLLQVSSAFGRAMESVDREKMCNALFPALLELKASGVDDNALRNVVAASAEGYSFPTNLDLDQPVDGLAPMTQAETVWLALQQRWTPSALRQQLAASARRHASSE
jgi:ectoine hydroxylase-related dioxygenase (phytanoyl-CoA dioxygenase family)